MIKAWSTCSLYYKGRASVPYFIPYPVVPDSVVSITTTIHVGDTRGLFSAIWGKKITSREAMQFMMTAGIRCDEGAA